MSRPAPPGRGEIGTYRADDTDSLVDRQDFFQVCTFEAPASAISRGGARDRLRDCAPLIAWQVCTSWAVGRLLGDHPDRGQANQS